jgi:hypothetical protein
LNICFQLSSETLLENLKKLNETICALHANYISGNRKKMNKMKENGFWLADIKNDWSYTCQPLHIRTMEELNLPATVTTKV